MFGSTVTTLNWYYHGKAHFTQTGYESHAAKYLDKEFHDRCDLTGRLYRYGQ